MNQPMPPQQPQIRPETPIAVPAMLVGMVLEYLNERPHKEVRNMIDALNRCQPIPQPEDPNAGANKPAA